MSFIQWCMWLLSFWIMAAGISTIPLNYSYLDSDDDFPDMLTDEQYEFMSKKRPLDLPFLDFRSLRLL